MRRHEWSCVFLSQVWQRHVEIGLVDAARLRGKDAVLSGPAGGVTGAAWVAGQAGFTDFLTFDMGGTSTDVALVQDLKPRIGRETTVGDLKVRATSDGTRSRKRSVPRPARRLPSEPPARCRTSLCM